MHSEIEELKDIEAKLVDLEIKTLRKRCINETTGLEILMEQEKELKTKNKKKKEDKIEEYRIIIDIVISEAEELKIKVINKLTEMKKIRTKTNELEKERSCVYDKKIVWILIIRVLSLSIQHE